MTTAELLERASKQKRKLAAATTAEKNEALEKIADALIKHTQNIIDENKKDIDDIKKEYLKGLKFHYVDHIKEVLETALLKA